jgi:hypothetical protein
MNLYDNKEEFEKLRHVVKDYAKLLTNAGSDCSLILAQQNLDGLFLQLYSHVHDAQINHEFCTGFLVRYLSAKSKQPNRDEFASVVLEFLKENLPE